MNNPEEERSAELPEYTVLFAKVHEEGDVEFLRTVRRITEETRLVEEALTGAVDETPLAEFTYYTA